MEGRERERGKEGRGNGIRMEGKEKGRIGEGKRREGRQWKGRGREGKGSEERNYCLLLVSLSGIGIGSPEAIEKDC